MKTITRNLSLLAVLAVSCAAHAVVVPTQTLVDEQQELRLNQHKTNRFLYATGTTLLAKTFSDALWSGAGLACMVAGKGAGFIKHRNFISRSFDNAADNYLACDGSSLFFAAALGYAAYKCFDVEKNKAWGNRKNKKRAIVAGSLVAAAPLAIGFAETAYRAYRSHH